jgi:iron complex outermembrane receptor protein
VEIGASLRVARTATLTGNYTALRTRQRTEQISYDGKQLPQRPAHQLYARADVARSIHRRLTILWGDFTFASSNFLDAGNVSEVPPRKLVGAGVKLEIVPRLLVGFEVKNLTDERVEYIELSPPPSPDLTRAPRAIADFFGYPLPGRSFYASVEWTH